MSSFYKLPNGPAPTENDRQSFIDDLHFQPLAITSYDREIKGAHPRHPAKKSVSYRSFTGLFSALSPHHSIAAPSAVESNK
jgi:hypothetical protein